MPSDNHSDAKSIDVRHEPQRSRYSATLDGALAVAEYHRHGNVIAFTHTEVPPEVQGRGVASALAHRALDDARAAGNQVIPACEFFTRYMASHPEYDDLRATRGNESPALRPKSSFGKSTKE
jgi:predicted GNAT family acetyltransferase